MKLFEEFLLENSGFLKSFEALKKAFESFLTILNFFIRFKAFKLVNFTLLSNLKAFKHENVFKISLDLNFFVH